MRMLFTGVFIILKLKSESRGKKVLIKLINVPDSMASEESYGLPAFQERTMHA